MKKRIALIYGGEGRERSISLLSARGVIKLLDPERYDLIPVFISHTGSWYIGSNDPFGAMPTAGATPTFPVMLHGSSGFLVSGGIMRIDAALPILHGDLGEDGVIQGALSAAHIPYVGCDVISSAACADKGYTKAVAASIGIRTAKWTVEYNSSDTAKAKAIKRAEETISYPMFVKPARLGSSIGARPVMCRRDLEVAYTAAEKYCAGVLIEELIPVSSEIECAYLEFGEKKLFCADGVVKTSGAAYSFKEKYVGGRITAKKDPSHPQKNEVESLSHSLVDALGLKGMARLDFFVTPSGELYFNEINTIPGMTERSLYPSLTEGMGLSHGEFLNRLIDGVTV